MGQVLSWMHAEQMLGAPVSARQAREFVTLHLRGHDLRALEDDIRLAASELVTNAMMHTQPPITVLLQRAGPLVTLSVSDPSSLPPTMSDGRVDEPGGLGLILVAAVSSGWGVTSRPGGGKSVWASFEADSQAVNGGGNGVVRAS